MATIRNVVEGLQILIKYSDPDEHNIQSEHDEIFGPGVSPDQMTEEDRKGLESYGWHYDKGLDSWKTYT